MEANPKESTPPPAGNGHKSRLKDLEDDGRPENPAASVAHAVPAYLKELLAYAQYYLSAKVDGFKATGKKIAAYAVLGVLAMFVGAGVLMSAAFLLLWGVAEGIGRAMGHPWIGYIIVGALVLGGAMGAAWIAVKKFIESSRKQTGQKYEGKRIQQRVDFGRDVNERARQSA